MRSSRTPDGFRSVLCPVDFSAHARRALRYAAAIAKSSAGRIVVLFVQDPRLLAMAAGPYTQQALTSAAEMQLRRFVATSLSRAGFAQLSIDYRIGRGGPAATIEATARQSRCDLIVMGTHGLNGVKKLFFGSTTRAVLRSASLPVLAVPRIDRTRRRHTPPLYTLAGTRFVAPVDWDAGYGADVRAAVDLARRFNAELLLLHVVPLTIPPPWFRAHPEALDRMRTREANERLERLASKFGQGVRMSCRAVLGNPSHEIAAVAEDRRVSLVVMTLRPGELWGATRGTVAYHVLCEGVAPVLTLPFRWRGTRVRRRRVGPSNE
jgi:nucleotide-binding universal stress UspA family protein